MARRQVTKTYRFPPRRVRHRLEYQVDKPFQARLDRAPYAQILRNDPRTKRSMFNVESYAFHGPAIYDGTKYRKLDPADHDDSHLAIDVRNGWIAALQHHFVSAIVPPKDEPYRFTLSRCRRPVPARRQRVRRTRVAPGATAQFGSDAVRRSRNCSEQLKQTGPELARVADYGHLYVLAQPLFSLLDKVHAVIGNWGVAIILVTFLLKLSFYPLSEASGRSMAKMKQLAPRIKNLQETYKDDARSSAAR